MRLYSPKNIGPGNTMKAAARSLLIAENPLVKSLRRHTHTELMTVNPLRAPCVPYYCPHLYPSRHRVFGDES
jgi:hypothetical protein